MLCPYCRTDLPPGTLRCSACTSWLPDRPSTREWRRAREGKMVAGVARGLANHYGVPVAAVRLLVVLTTVLGFWGLPVYLLLWWLMPVEPELPRPVAAPVQQAAP
jgi:phage shock protein PspC (stress-responsive transcriptional regulator)